MRRNLETELPPDRPGHVGGRIPKIDFAAHDHMDEPVLRGRSTTNHCCYDARRVRRIFVARIGAENVGPRSRNSRTRIGAPYRSAPGWQRPSAAGE